MHTRTTSCGTSRGFTLVELLVAFMIVAILVAVLLPAVQTAREAARRLQCFNNLKQISMAVHHYHDAFEVLPPAWIGLDTATNEPWVDGPPGWGWGAHILPFVEQQVLYEQIRPMKPILDPVHAPILAATPIMFRCRSDQSELYFDLMSDSGPWIARLPVSNYVAVFGTTPLDHCKGLPPGVSCQGDGCFSHHASARLADIADGTSFTLMFGERSTRSGHSTWVGVVAGGQDAAARVLGVADHPPNTVGVHLDDFTSRHATGTSFAFADGSVRLIPQTIDLDVFRSMATRDGGEMPAR